MPDRKLIVEIAGDARSLDRAYAQATRSTKSFGREVAVSNSKLDKLNRIGVGGGLAAIGGGVLASKALDQINQAIDATSALQEQTNKSRVVFGAASREIEAFGDTTADAFGISKRAAIEAAGTFGGLFTTLGIGRREAASFSTDLVGLAGDLSSFFDAAPTEVLTALRSGLIGEAEPLRRFNVLLSESRVQQEALATTGKTSVKQLTDEEKVRARLAIIMRDTVQAQGDVARTSDSLANKERIAAANAEDLRAKLGALVLPIKSDLVGALTDAIEAVDLLATGVERLGNLQIPAIKIPMVIDVESGSVFEFLGDFRKFFGSDAPKTWGKLLGGEIADAVDAATKRINEDLLRGSPIQLPQIRGDEDKKRPDRRRPDGPKPEAITSTNALTSATLGLSSATEIATRKEDAHTAALARLETAADRAALNVDRVSLALQDASATPTLRDDIEAYREIGVALEAQEAAILKKIALDKDNVAFQSELVSLQGQQMANEQSLASAIERRAANQKAARQAEEAAEKLRLANQRRRAQAEAQARQFRALGFTGTGDEKVPGVDALKRQLGSLDKAIEGTFLDTGKTSSMMSRIRKVLSGGLGKLSEDVREKIAQMLDDLDSQLRNADDGPLTKFRKANTDKIVAGLGLSPEEVKALRARLSQVGLGGTVPGHGVSAFGMALPGAAPTVIHTTVELDGDKVGQSTHRWDQRNGRRNPPGRRGRFAGGGV